MPAERGTAGFHNETSGDPRFPVGVVGLFQANFSIELNKRQASMDVLANALSALANPEPIDMSKYQQQEAAYQAAISTARNMQEASVFNAMKDACDALVAKLRIDCPATNPALIEASLDGGARRQGNDCYNVISIRDRALGIQADGRIIARRQDGLIKGMSGVGQGGVRQFYEGPEGNVVGLIDAFVPMPPIFSATRWTSTLGSCKTGPAAIDRSFLAKRTFGFDVNSPDATLPNKCALRDEARHFGQRPG